MVYSVFSLSGLQPDGLEPGNERNPWALDPFMNIMYPEATSPGSTITTSSDFLWTIAMELGQVESNIRHALCWWWNGLP